MVKDTEVNEYSGNFTDWRLILWGEAIDGDKQELFPMPTEDEDEFEAEPDEGSVETTIVSVPSSTTLPAHPTDHPDRPVNQKPSAASTTSSPATATDEPTHTDEQEVGTKPDAAASATATETSSFFPSMFPTFGVSPRTQIWIYGAITLILIFCIALGTYMFMQRRKKRGIDRDDYEFAVLTEEDGADTGPGGKQRRRGGELYDAFAGESDEELFFSDEETPGYRDEEDEKAGMMGRAESPRLDEKA